MTAKMTPINTKDLGSNSQKMLAWFKERHKGQDRALEDLVQAVALYNNDLNDPNQPIFKALFLGPSGSGKTHLVELLAEYLFNNRNGLTKINCAELKQSHEVARLIGSPPGYVGYQDPSGPNYDPESGTPLLSQWNVDKHHFMSISQAHEDEIRKVTEQLKKIAKQAEVLEELTKEVVTYTPRLKKIEELIEHLAVREKSETDSANLKIISKQLKEARQRRDQLNKEYNDKLKKLEADSDFLTKEELSSKQIVENLKKLGVFYDFEHPNSYLSVILFDEIEKAHDDLFNILLEVMDKGRLQLSNGRITDLRHSFIFMTGNVASEKIADILSGGRIGFRQQESKNFQGVDKEIYNVTVEEAQKVFSPAFMGRLDKIIVFRPLTLEALIEIVDIHLQELHQRFLKSEKPIVIELDRAAKEFIAKEALVRTELGARVLKARVKKYINNRLVRAFDNGSLSKGDAVIVKLEKIGEKEKLVFYKKE